MSTEGQQLAGPLTWAVHLALKNYQKVLYMLLCDLITLVLSLWVAHLIYNSWIHRNVSDAVVTVDRRIMSKLRRIRKKCR